MVTGSIQDEIHPNKYRGYCGNMNNHIIPYFKANPVSLQDLTPMVLEDYYFSLLRPESNLETGTALSTTTICHHHQNISKALSDAVRQGLIIANPASSARLPKKEKFKGNFYNTEQLAEMERLFENTAIYLPVTLCAIYGFRRSEVLGLCWDKIDFYNRTITISQTLQQGAGGDYLDQPKTESSYRALPLTNKAERLLKKQKEIQEQNRILMGDYYVHSSFVCTHPDGRVITPNYLTRNFHAILTKSNLPMIRFHDLRHSSASNLLASNFSVVQIQEWLGHSSPATTLNFYSHVDKTSKMEIADRLDELDNKEKVDSKHTIKVKKPVAKVKKKIQKQIKKRIQTVKSAHDLRFCSKSVRKTLGRVLGKTIAKKEKP